MGVKVDNNELLQKETMKRFHSVMKSESNHRVSQKAKKAKECRDRSLLIKEARAIGCTIEELA